MADCRQPAGDEQQRVAPARAQRDPGQAGREERRNVEERAADRHWRRRLRPPAELNREPEPREQQRRRAGGDAGQAKPPEQSGPRHGHILTT
jgi:hypothetical protein